MGVSSKGNTSTQKMKNYLRPTTSVMAKFKSTQDKQISNTTSKADLHDKAQKAHAQTTVNKPKSQKRLMAIAEDNVQPRALFQDKENRQP